ncbi:hypothetical protein K1T71_011280 [Dendrolimus kikuchii]|uniref:Uncharacterized protein n=1 Tax=Dendrolimus kikuchii TaxID=765133 RepID=A0ACC1CNB0_9NEOP|nr:hypothetical protein K1T71_011280 [Dendrolimus kikuchii]
MFPINTPYDFELFYKFYLKFVSETLVYFKNFALYVGVWVLGYILVCCVVYRRYARRLPTRTRGALGAKRVLVVVAHPDDECMFFGPTIFRLCEQGADVHLLCLSNAHSVLRSGSWFLLGLGLNSFDNWIPNRWYLPTIFSIEIWVFFDFNSLTHHSRYETILFREDLWVIESDVVVGFIQRCTVYTLDSVNILRKYWGFLDLPLSFVLSSKRYFLRWTESRRIVRAMRRHKSQMVWFRYLYVVFSRYMIINTLRRIRLADIELELEVDD